MGLDRFENDVEIVVSIRVRKQLFSARGCFFKSSETSLKIANQVRKRLCPSVEYYFII